MTYKELKEQLEKLTEEQLNKEVIWWGDECGRKIDGVFCLEEDYVNCGDGYWPLSGYVNESAEYLQDECMPRMLKGTPILNSDTTT